MDAAHETEKSPVSPRDLALAYDRVVSAHWRGETEAATAIGTWFESHWSDHAPPEPDAPPEGTSVLGGGGSGIRWYTCDEAVLGYVARRDDGCYRVRTTEALPSFMASWDILELEATRQPDADHLLQQTGASPATAHSKRAERQPAARRQRAQDTVPETGDVRVLVEPDATNRHAGEDDEVAGREPARTEGLVAFPVMEPAPAGDSSGVLGGT